MTEAKPLSAQQVLDALAATRTVKEAAAQLGISERTLYRRMDDFGIRVKRHAVLDAAA